MYAQSLRYHVKQLLQQVGSKSEVAAFIGPCKGFLCNEILLRELVKHIERISPSTEFHFQGQRDPHTLQLHLRCRSQYPKFPEYQTPASACVRSKERTAMPSMSNDSKVPREETQGGAAEAQMGSTPKSG